MVTHSSTAYLFCIKRLRVSCLQNRVHSCVLSKHPVQIHLNCLLLSKASTPVWCPLGPPVFESLSDRDLCLVSIPQYTHSLSLIGQTSVCSPYILISDSGLPCILTCVGFVLTSPSTIDVSCTIHESRVLVEVLPSVRSVLCTIHTSRSVRKWQVRKKRNNMHNGAPRLVLRHFRIATQ